MEIIIIGGGASGMAAAIEASRNPECHVRILERQNRVGRKLLATGNGRCNLSNANAGPLSYHGAENNFAAYALERLSFENTMDFFHRLGLLTVQEESGRVYPWSDQAGSVVDVLRFALEKPNIELLTGFEVKKVTRNGDGFTVIGPEKLECDRLIIACGGLAGTALGGSMSGYQLLRNLGHKCTKLRPALVQLKSSYPRCAALKGIRAVCHVDLTCNDTLAASSYGEVQFTQYGLSGPAVFELSRWACAEKGEYICHLDMLPGFTKEQILAHLENRKASNPDLETGELLTGTVHNRLGKIILQEAGIALNLKLADLTKRDFQTVAEIAKDFQFTITEPMGMDSAQVTAGGILTSDFDPMTMESKICPNLYACGEVLDIDGDCGGFNLQWAWSSGRLAGSSAGRFHA